MTTITFCGHGSIPLPLHSEIRKKLSEVLKTSAKEGAVRFLLGGYGDFDNICADEVKKLKKDFENIESILVLPYPRKTIDTSPYDKTIIAPLGNVSPQKAIPLRNRFLVDSSEIVIAYVKNPCGGAKTTLDYAALQGKYIVNLAF